MITSNNITYKDDFKDSNVEDKNYLRILFNGGRSVQIRELNQIQSILQSQIDKFGSSVYNAGAPVIGGACTFDRKIRTVVFSNPTLSGIVPSDIVTLIQSGASGNISADVISYNRDENFTTFYVRYGSGGSEDNGGGLFNITNQIGVESGVVGGNSGSVTAAEIGIVAGAFLSKGVFFINGCFVVTPKQSIFIDETASDITGLIALNVIEKNVTYIEDNTLLDNADGQPNFLAPGADRYQITLSLAYIPAESLTDEINRISLLEIVDGNVVMNTKIRYSDLDRQLAQRTSEESGDYIVNPFKIEISELQNSKRPGSLLSNASENVYIGLEPSVAYVDGYRIELEQKLNLTAPRARSTQEKSVAVSLNFGNYIDIIPSGSSKMPSPNTASILYELKKTVAGPSYVVIGSTRIKSIETVGAAFRLFLYDINLTGAFNISDISNISNVSEGVNLNVQSAVQETSSDTSVFKLPYDNVRSVAAINPSDLSYVIKKTYINQVDSLGKFTITTGANETFGDSAISNFIIEVGGVWLPTGAATVDVSSTNSITIKKSSGSWTSGQNIKVIFPVTVSSNTPATKTLTQVSQSGLTPTGSTYLLSNTDIYDIVSVVINGTSVNIKDDIIISSDGQRPSKYTNGELKYIGSGTPPIITVVYRHFIHSGLPFTANSYPINWDESSTLQPDQIRYVDVPSFNKSSLADCVDFRPVILEGGGVITTIQPDPNSVLNAKPTFFLPRIDKLIVNSNGKFSILPGIPKLSPVSVITPPSSMVLYEIEYPSYTFKASDVIVKFVDNRRYTMRDIGSLDKRVSNLEYYTSLSLLESSVNDKSIFDAVQGARFKNGLLVDAFNGHSVGNVFLPAHRCAIDNSEGTLRPRFNTDAVDLVFSAASSSGVKLNENTITLQFTEAPLISQLASSESESVNPYDVASFIGNIKLFPTNDQWFETNRRPDVIINEDGAYDALKYSLKESGILGTQWNSWKTNWTGVLSKTSSAPHSVRAPDGVLRARDTEVVASIKSRGGVKTKLVSKVVNQNLGDRVVDISFVPFIRSRKVYFDCRGLKPNTRVYPFFDDIDISAYTREVVNLIKPSGLTSIREYINKQPGDAGFITGAPLISDADGQLLGEFIVPNNALLKFRTGERVFRVSDSVTNNTEEETTFAEGNYNAAGTSKTVETTIISTRVPKIKKERVKDVRVALDTKVRYYDPLAQSFVINDIPEGAFVTSLDLYFTQKSRSNLPVTVRLVAVDNGYPTQRVIPFSEVTLRAADVIIDGTATNFEFSDPVYLKAGVEYAIVVLSNDPQYRIRVSRLGGIGEDGKIIQKNPYGGVMFMSQNASTWTPDQTRDIKFVLNRAVFTTVTGNAIFKTILREGVQSIKITNGGSQYTGATVTIGAPTEFDGVQATATAIIDPVSKTIIDIVVTEAGAGYLSAPSITITRVPSGLGDTATATASLYTAKVSAFNLIQNSAIQDNTAVYNELNVNTITYTDVIATENYIPTSNFVISPNNIATVSSSLISESSYISPIIDLDTMSLLCIENEINNIKTRENSNDGGDALSRYITREVELNDPADQLNIYVDVNRPTTDTTISLFVKLKYDSESYSQWIEVESQTKIAVTDDSEKYDEVQYIHSSPENDFISFAVKIVFTSSETSSVTTLKNLRIIATS